MGTLEEGLAIALRSLRLYQGMTQVDFKGAASDGYVSRIERGIYSPSLTTICQIAEAMRIHPLSLLTLAFELAEGVDRDDLMMRVEHELSGIGKAQLAMRPGRGRPKPRKKLFQPKS